MEKVFKFRLIESSEDYKLFVGKTMPADTLLPLLYVSEAINENCKIQQVVGKDTIEKKLEKIETNLLSITDLGFENKNGAYYVLTVSDKKYQTNTEVLTVNDDKNLPGGTLFISEPNTSDWKQTNFGSVGEFELGQRVGIKVITKYCDTYINNITIEKNQKPLTVLMTKTKGQCTVKLGEKLTKLWKNNQIAIEYSLNDGKQKTYTSSQKNFEFEFGDTVVVKCYWLNNSQPEVVKTYKLIDSQELLVDFKDEIIVIKKYPVTFNVKYLAPNGTVISETEDTPNIYVSVNKRTEVLVNNNEPFEIDEESRVEYRIESKGYDTATGVIEQLNEPKTIDTNLIPSLFNVHITVAPNNEEFEFLIDGIKKNSEDISNVFKWYYSSSHTVTIIPKNINLAKIEKTVVCEGITNLNLELVPVEIRLRIIDKETGKEIKDGSVYVKTKAYEKTVSMAELENLSFNAGELVNVSVSNTGFKTHTFENLLLNLSERDGYEYLLELPNWRLPKLSVSVVDDETKEMMENVDISIVDGKTMKAIKIGNSDTINVPTGKYYINIKADNKQNINKEIELQDDYVEIFNMEEVIPDIARFDITHEPKFATLEVNGSKFYSREINLGSTIHVKCFVDGYNYKPFEEDVVVDNIDFHKHIVLERVPWQFVINPNYEDREAIYYINNEERTYYETQKQERVTLVGTRPGYHDWIHSIVISSDTPLINEITPEFVPLNEALPTEQFLDTIEALMKPRRYYNYLSIGRIFKRQGFNIKSLYLFYTKFARYCHTKTDYKIYNLCKVYFENNPMD